MKLSYRTRCALKRLGKILLVLIAVAILAYVLWLAWLERFIVYSREEGAKLDFSYSITDRTGIVAQKPADKMQISVIYNDGQLEVETEELKKIQGYYVTSTQLQKDPEGVLAKLQELPKGTAVMIDVKDMYGNFFYSSAISENRSSSIDPEVMDRFIETINGGNLYTIAHLPAFRDMKYGMKNIMSTLQDKYGYGYYDFYGCYWLVPSKTSVQEYVTQIALELRGLGFREVVFYDFCFPDTDSIVYSGDKKQALFDAAQLIVKTCATDRFTVSFEDKGFGIPEGRCRIYGLDVPASNVESYVEKFERENPEASFVFMTEMHDTRYEKYGVLRPLK